MTRTPAVLLAPLLLAFCPLAGLAQPLTRADIQSRYDATPNNGTITTPTGIWPAAAWGAPVSPQKSDPDKSVLWTFTSPSSPHAAIGDNDLTESFWGGHLNLQRSILSGNPGNASLFLSLDDFSRDYKTIPYNYIGEFPDVPALQINATTHPNSLGQLNGIEVFLNSQGNNPMTSEDQGLDIKVDKSGQNSTWALSTMTNDTSGRPPAAFASIAAELDLLANGPDDPRAVADPESGNRIFLWLVGKISPVPPWTPNHKFAAGDRILASTNGTPTVYIATTAGSTAAAAPAWPTSGTVTDASVTWAYGEPYAVTFARGIALDSQRGQPVSFSTGFSSNAAFANAVIDLSAASLLRPTAAGLRLAANMPLDFSANATAAGQNRHTLAYKPGTGLTYATASTPVLTITDAGHLLTGGPAPSLSACGATASLSATATDRHGTVTPSLTPTTTCTLTFATPYAASPDCLLTGFTPTPPYIATLTPTALTVTTQAKFTYLCEQ